jgi:hypothetical protein
MTYRSTSRRAFDRGTLLGRQVLFFEPDGGANPTGGTGGNPPADDRQNLQGLLQRHNNDAMAVVATLLSENHSLRDERRTLRGQLPAQGAVVLSPEQAQQWTAYQGLGALDALQQQLQQAQTAQSELSGLRRESLLGRVQEASGYKASVLGKLPGADKLDFEVRETTVDGKAVKSVVVKDGGKETALADYVKANWADFEPALVAGQQQQQQPSGTAFVRQSGSGTATGGDVASEFLKQAQAARDAAPNPLAPKQA